MNQNDREFLIRQIKTDYTEKKPSELDALRALDKRAKRPALLFGYFFGSFSALVLGAGMSLVMTNIGELIGISAPLIPGILIGLLGILMAAVNYPIYKVILKHRKKRFAKEIISLSEQILES